MPIISLLRNIFLLSLLVLSLHARAQKDLQPTDQFTVTGLVKQNAVFRLADIQKLETREVKNFVLSNQRGEFKDSIKSFKGVLLQELLSQVDIKAGDPKSYNTFYFTCEAADGYKAVFSWNEIFNSPAGDNIYIVTEKEGINAAELKDRILLITTSDFKTGRRHIRNLQKIIVRKAD